MSNKAWRNKTFISPPLVLGMASKRSFDITFSVDETPSTVRALEDDTRCESSTTRFLEKKEQRVSNEELQLGASKRSFQLMGGSTFLVCDSCG